MYDIGIVEKKGLESEGLGLMGLGVLVHSCRRTNLGPVLDPRIPISAS